MEKAGHASTHSVAMSNGELELPTGTGGKAGGLTDEFCRRASRGPTVGARIEQRRGARGGRREMLCMLVPVAASDRDVAN